MADTSGPDNVFSSPEAYFFEADRLINAGEANKAYILLEECVEKFPDFGKAYNHLGFIQETQYKSPQKAEPFYLKCLELSPDYPAVYLNYSVLLSTHERYEELEKLLETALTVPGMNKAKVYNEYGIMHEVRSNYDSAIEAYRKAIQFSFIQANIKSYEASIERVESKKRLLN